MAILRDAIVAGCEYEKVLSKIEKYWSIVGKNSKLAKPVIVPLNEGEKVAFLIDKSAAKGARLTIKAPVSSVEEWGRSVGEEMNCIFDGNGQMIQGNLTYNMGANFGDFMTFSRNPRNIRRIQYRGSDYMPLSQDNTWGVLRSSPGAEAVENDVEAMLDKGFLGAIFRELSAKHTKIR